MIDRSITNGIESLSARDFTRLRPGVYAGSTEYSTQLLREIFSNALDEHIAGNGDKIKIKADLIHNEYSVQDNGRGFPVNVLREDGETVLQAAFDVMNTSGKYRNGEKDSFYTASLGSNGCGGKLTNFLSKELRVFTCDGSMSEELWFVDGIFERRTVGRLTGKSGTTVTWKPDPQFFQHSEVNISELKKLFEDVSALCPDLIIDFEVINGSDRAQASEFFQYYTPNGLQELVDKKVGKKELLNTRFTACKKENNELFDIAMTYTNSYSENIIAYANYGLTESGMHISTVKAGLTRQINRYAIDKNLLKKSDDPITQAELAEGLLLVFNVKAGNVKYDSQTKTRIVDINKALINSAINNDFWDWLNNNPRDAKIVIDKALLARKAKEAAQKAKNLTRGLKQKKSDKAINLPTKLVDAYTKNRKEAELFICEGNSAAGGLIAKRNGETQAIFPVRGKVLSCRKASMDKIYANQEIANIVKAIGLDIDKSTGKLIYDAKKLRYGKIVLAADSDDDGKAIVSLLINMFWWLCQDLVINGNIYIAYPPLFRITTKKNEYIYLRDEKELANYKKKHKNESFIISHNKGLGESSHEELKYCLLDPNTRNVKQLIVEDQQATDDLLECFFGTNVETRRQYLLDYIEDFVKGSEH